MPDFDLYRYIQSAYRGVNAYADSLDESLLKKIHIQTGLDKAVESAIKKGNSIVLTGNPGDGKTHLLRYLATRIKSSQKSAVVELDASEKLNQDIIKAWKKTHRSGAPFCIAINEAVLFELAKNNPTFEPVVDAQRQVEKAIVYFGRSSKPPKSNKSQVAVFDLSRRNVLTEDIVSAVLDKFCNCKFPPECEGIYEIGQHAELMKDSLFRQRLQVLLNRLVRRRFHCTLRELIGFVGYLLGKGMELPDLSVSTGNSENFLTELIYSKDAKGNLFDQISAGFNPGHVCHPILDSRIVTNELPSDSWSTEEVELFHSADVDDVLEIERRRRRFYFFNKSGEHLLKLTSDVDASFQKLLALKNDRDVLRDLLPRINLAFRFRRAVDGIRVWKSHHFADEPKHEMLLSMQVINRKQLDVVYPVLTSPMNEAFLFLPDHLVIQPKDHPEIKLQIDFEMYQFLCATEFGISISSVTNHLTRRLWQFMQRLSVINTEQEDEVEIVIFDLETNETTELVIDTEEPRYISIQSN